MVICLRMFLSIIHFLITHSEFFFPADTSRSLTGCIILCYRDSDIILRIFLQIIHTECFEYAMQFHTKYKLAGVPLQFSPGHGPDSLSLPKSYTATTEEKLLPLLLFLHPIFLSTVWSKSALARSFISFSISWTGYRNRGCFQLSLSSLTHFCAALTLSFRGAVPAALGGHLR